jgi:GH25 family lysozyme M1 (1,4-beta-N-acetylmuramidase)
MAVQSAQGLDVSDFQGRFSWGAAKQAVPGLAFGVYRLTQGLGASGTVSPDPDAAWNHQQIAANGLHRGAYHFLDPHLPGEAQAQYFVAEHARLGTAAADMFWLDNETAGASPAETAACAVAFMGELDKLVPHNPRGVYTFIDFAREGNCAGLENDPLWLAYPAATAPSSPPPWHRWTFWQWGQRNGADTDAFNGTAAQLDDWIAGFAPSTGPFRHVAPGNRTLAQIAAARNATVDHLVRVTISALTAGDVAAIGGLTLPAGFPWYSSNP